MRKLRFAAALLVLGSFGGLLYLGSLIPKAIPKAEAQTAVNACVSGTCRASRLALPTNGKLCTNSACTDYIQNTGSTTLIRDSSGVSFDGTLTSNAYTFTVNGAGVNVLRTTGAASNAPLILIGSHSDGATAVGVALDNGSALSTAGAKIASFRNNGTEKAYVDKDGNIVSGSTGYIYAGTSLNSTTGLQINRGGGSSKPTCDSSTRGTFWVVSNGAGVKDTVEVCAKDAGDAYDWRTIY